MAWQALQRAVFDWGALRGIDAEAAARRGAIPANDQTYEGPATIETYTVFHSREGDPTGGTIVALTPDGRTLLVTAVADRALVAYDAETGRERWRRPLASEPRGVAISPSGAQVLVAYLGTGTVERIVLGDGSASGSQHVALGAQPHLLRELRPVEQHARRQNVIRDLRHDVGELAVLPLRLADRHEAL